nr:hypothetical protein [Tanacetum cinerariifolium]
MVTYIAAQPSLDYLPGPEYPPSPEFIPEPVYPEYMPPKDEILPAEEQPLPTAVSPTIDSPGYVLKFDSEEDPNDDLVDYPVNGGDDDNDDDESSDDDEEDDDDIEKDEDEEHLALVDSTAVALPAKETKMFETDESAATPPPHPAYRSEQQLMASRFNLLGRDMRVHAHTALLMERERLGAPADSVVVAPTAADQAPSAEETEPFETDESAATPLPHPPYHMTARISIPAPVPMPAWTNSEIVRLLAMSSPPASPLSPWSSPPPQIPFPPLPSILSPPSPAASTSSPPLQLPSASRREDRPVVTLPPQKRLGIALGPRYEVEESSSTAAARPAGGPVGGARVCDHRSIWIDIPVQVDAFLAVKDEPTSSQLPKLYLDPEGDILLLEAFLNDDHSSDFKTKSSSTSLNSLLEETNNFDNSLPEFTTFSNVLFDAEYKSDSNDDQSCSNEDVLEKIISKPSFEEKSFL